MFSSLKITNAMQLTASLDVVIPRTILHCNATAQPPVSLIVSSFPSLDKVQTCSSLNSSSRFESPPVNAPTYNHILPIIKHVPDPLKDVGVVLDPAVGDRVIGDPVSNRVIGDPVSDRVIGDPVVNGGFVVGDAPEQRQPPAIEARHIQKIRRWHMNRHQLKRRRKKHRMMFWGRRQTKVKRKEKMLKTEVAAILKDGEQFDALSFIEQRLERAKRGGFKQDFWASEESQPEVAWPEYGPLPRKWKSYEPSDGYKLVRKALIAQRNKRRSKLKQLNRRLTFKF